MVSACNYESVGCLKIVHIFIHFRLKINLQAKHKINIEDNANIIKVDNIVIIIM